MVETKTSLRRFGKSMKVMAFFLPILLVGYANLEPVTIQVTRHKVVLAGLPKRLDGLRVLHITDLHRSSKHDDMVIDAVVQVSNKLHPDIVVFTGDFTRWGSENAMPCAGMVSKIRARLGCYAVLGNHDYTDGACAVRSALAKNGIPVLTNKNICPVSGLHIIGIDPMRAGNGRAAAAWNGVPPDAGHIVITHAASSASLFAGHRCLALSGHTHGGEVGIPGIGRVSLPTLISSKFIQGWCRTANANIYVNRGIGAINPTGVRFFCRPEIALFTLHPYK